MLCSFETESGTSPMLGISSALLSDKTPAGVAFPLKIRLNRYASRDVQQVAGKASAIDSLLCFHSIPGPAIAVDSRGKPTFSFPLGRNTKDQQACLAKLSLQKTCE